MLSSRVLNMEPSATLEITAKVTELNYSGIDIISFNVGEPDFNTPENIRRAAQQAIEEGFTKYTAVSGIIQLREAICEKLKKDNAVEYIPSEISVGTGAKQPLVNALLAICDYGDEVLLPIPCWVSYIEMIKLAGANPVLIPSNEKKEFELDIEEIEKAITKNTKAIIINTPNNPTGAVYSKETLNKLAELAVKYNFYIISDEIYEKLIYDGIKHFCIASVSSEVKAKTIIINGFSKAYAMTGWRMGYAAGPIDVIKAMNCIQGHMTSAPNSITQKAAIEALRGSQDDLEAMRKEFEHRRNYVLARLNKMKDITCFNAKGTFYLMPNVSKLYGKVYKGKVMKNSIDIANFLLETAHIAVVPGEAFKAPNNLRISYSNSMDNIIEGMNRMEKALELLI